MDDAGRSWVLRYLCDQAHVLESSANIILSIIDRYVAALLAHNDVHCSLIGNSTVPVVWSRHVLDCLHVGLKVLVAKYDTIIDLGSGAGLPGIIIAIINPRANIALIEKSPRKALFLKKIVAELQLTKVTIFNEDVQHFSNACRQYKVFPQCIVARAFKALTEIFDMTKEFMPNAVYYLQKGVNYQQEITQASKHYHFTHAIEESINDSGGVLLTISGISKK